MDAPPPHLDSDSDPESGDDGGEADAGGDGSDGGDEDEDGDEEEEEDEEDEEEEADDEMGSAHEGSSGGSLGGDGAGSMGHCSAIPTPLSPNDACLERGGLQYPSSLTQSPSPQNPPTQSGIPTIVLLQSLTAEKP